MRKLLFNLHLYIALIAGLFVLILGITGSIMAFEPEIDRMFHPNTSYVTAGDKPLSLTEITAAVAKVFPDEAISGYTMARTPGLSYNVSMKRGTVFVNQYTGEVLGVRKGDGTDWLSYVHQLHLRLAWRSEGDPGKSVISWAGVLIVTLLVSGIFLWWPSKRTLAKRGTTGRRFWFDIHNMLGVFSFVFLLVLSLTGLMIGFEKVSVPLFYSITGSTPSAQPKVPPPVAGAPPIGPDQALKIAAEALPGAIPFAINAPDPKGSYQIRSAYPEDRTPGGRSRVMVDQYTGAVLFAEGSRTAPGGTRLVIVNRAIHTGDLFGLPSKIVVALASFMLVVQLLTGLVMLWKRWRQKA